MAWKQKGPWEKRAWILRGVAIGLGAAAAAAGPGWIALGLVGAAASIGFWTKEYPRDRWTPEQRRARLKKSSDDKPTPPPQPFHDE